MVNKEMGDHVRSWRFIILLALILLTCFSSLYTALTNIGAASRPNDPNASFFFLKLFTLSDGNLPSFHIFIGFLGPLLGISPSAWDEACTAMGDGQASAVLAAILQRGAAIKKPGGYLRNLARRAAAGELSAWPMLMALLRARMDAQAAAIAAGAASEGRRSGRRTEGTEPEAQISDALSQSMKKKGWDR